MNTNREQDKTNKIRFFDKAGIVTIVAFILVPAAFFYLQEFMIRNPFEKMKGPIQILNIVFWILAMLLMYAVTGRLKVAVWICGGVSLILGTLNYYVISFRGAPVQPWDIPSARVAMSVASDYDYSIPAKLIICGGGIILICIVFGFINIKLPSLFKCNNEENKPHRGQLIRAGVIVLNMLLMIGYWRYVQGDTVVSTFKMYDKLFTPTTVTYRDGIAVSFIMEAKYISVDKPDGYSDEKAREILAQYESDESATATPNIIVIMNEAFADTRILADYETNTDVMPFVDSLMDGAENVVSGYMEASVLGGNTANTEYEFLTGDSMAFLPQGCIPYQQYVREDVESMASVLKAQGYNTVALHPYKATGWNRDKVYDYFGFDEFHAIDEFSDEYMLRKYVSDIGDYEKLLELYEEKKSDGPLFMFNVTMQNHSSYTDVFDNCPIDVMATGIDSVATNQYLTLINKSDDAFRLLTEYLSNVKEPVLVVFFGDHQPTDSVVQPLYKYNGESVYALDSMEVASRYIVPFVIWANYDIEEENGVVTNPAMLGARAMKIAGVKSSPYMNYLNKMSESIASVNTIRSVGVDGSVTPIDEAKGELVEYQTLEYYHLYGKEK